MQHEEFVEAAVLDAPLLALNVAVPDMDLRGLAEARELLVRRLRGEDARAVGPQPGEAHGKAAGIERMKLHEARPRLVEQDVVAEMADLLDDGARVVDRAVVGALFDHCDAEGSLALPRLLVLDQRVRANLLANMRLVERLVEDRPDQPVRVAVGFEVHRRAVAQEQRAMVRGLVVVAVEQDKVAFRHQRLQHDLVGRRGAVQHEIGLLRAEDLRRFLLGLEGRAFVDQQVAEVEDRIVEVVAKHRLAKVLHEDAANRAPVVEDAAIVARAGPELVAFLGIVDQRAEERRLQGFGVPLQAAHQVSGDEIRCFLGEEDVAVDVVHHLDRNILQPLAADQNHNRHLEPAPAHQVDQRRGLAVEALLAPVDHHAANRRVGLHNDLRILHASRPHDLETEMLDGRRYLAQPVAFEIVGVEGRSADQDGEAPEEIHCLACLKRRGGRAVRPEPAF